MNTIVVDRIVSRRDYGTIFAGRTADGGAVRVKAGREAMIGEPGIGETWSVTGDIEQSAWGPQIKAARAVRAMPSGTMMIDFLSRSVGGIGPMRAQRLWDHFEDRLPETLDIGDVDAIAAVMEPERPVLGPRIAAALVAKWTQMTGEARLVEWLSAAGLTDIRLARRIHALLGDDAPARLQANPWCLVPLLSWSKVDELGLRLASESGNPSSHDLPDRLVGAADAVVKDVIATGSTAIDAAGFRNLLAVKLGADPASPLLDTACTLAIERRAVVDADGLLRAPGCALMEDAVTSRLAGMPGQGPSDRLRALLDALDSDSDGLSAEQAAAVRKALSSGFACLRGGAGTGKTHVARAICRIWEAAGGNLLLTAVAGKAALRLSRSTGRLARTVFRTLRELDERSQITAELGVGPEPAEVEKLAARLRELARADADTLVIVDEASMLDLSSAHGLLRRLPDGARLLLIGDERQLPPVGMGLLFHRFVHDATVTATLASVRRQASDSEIPVVAAKIRRREVPSLLPYGGQRHGVWLLDAAGRESIAEKVVAARAELGGGADVMIVTPVNDGPCGVIGLNRRLHDDYVEKNELQELRGPLGDLFSPGEPVVHRRNDYRRCLFNGSLGTVKRIDRSQRSLTAVFDDEEHSFEGDELVDLALGYALTCHRAQGSEARHVIVALPPGRLLDPSWLYTAVTRASTLVIIVGEAGTTVEALGRPYTDDRRLVGLRWPVST